MRRLTSEQYPSQSATVSGLKCQIRLILAQTKCHILSDKTTFSKRINVPTEE